MLHLIGTKVQAAFNPPQSKQRAFIEKLLKSTLSSGALCWPLARIYAYTLQTVLHHMQSQHDADIILMPSACIDCIALPFTPQHAQDLPWQGPAQTYKTRFRRTGCAAVQIGWLSKALSMSMNIEASDQGLSKDCLLKASVWHLNACAILAES